MKMALKMMMIIIDPDFVPNLEISFEDTQELDIDNIIENIEYDAIVPQQPAIATTSSQAESSSRRQNIKKKIIIKQILI